MQHSCLLPDPHLLAIHNELSPVPSPPFTLFTYIFTLLGSLFYPEDGGSSFLRNVVNYQITRRHIPETALSSETDSDPWVWERGEFIADYPFTVKLMY
jgi:hypothetical protein